VIAPVFCWAKASLISDHPINGKRCETILSYWYFVCVAEDRRATCRTHQRQDSLRCMKLQNLVGELGVESFDHTAIAVHDINAALPLYRDLLGGVPSGFERLSDRGFMWLALRYPNGSVVELIAPHGEPGFLHAFLDKHGEGPHHMTFIVRDLHLAVDRARAAGLRVVDEDYRNPRWQEAFISPRTAFGTIVQLAQSDLDAAARDQHWSVAGLNLADI
jgi:methylmalonyl-CoA/ethylmalonyl-CoA epimerase